ncbi:MAG TPA: hypothetical protein VHO92_02975 [Methanobacterium sp.]|nr:hypothetical protein [Methanobacterium sp.]
MADLKPDNIVVNAVVIIVALIVIVWAFNLVIGRVTDAKDIIAIFSGVTGVIGIIIGAYFGVNVGTTGKQEAVDAQKQVKEDALKTRNQAIETRDAALQSANELALLIDPTQINELSPESKEFLKSFKS